MKEFTCNSQILEWALHTSIYQNANKNVRIEVTCTLDCIAVTEREPYVLVMYFFTTVEHYRTTIIFDDL